MPPTRKLDENRTQLTVAKIALIGTIAAAFLGLVGTIVAAYLSSQAAQAPILIPIQATQTAEAKLAALSGTLILPSTLQRITPIPASSTLDSSCTVELDSSLVISQQKKALLGCPDSPAYKPLEKDLALAWQQFNDDQVMIWRKYPQGTIYVLYNDNGQRRWLEFEDPGNKPCPQGCDVCDRTPPVVSGFGQVWCNNPLVQDKLNKAIDKQRSISGIVQDFKSGRGHAIRVKLDQTYLLWPDSSWEVQR